MQRWHQVQVAWRRSINGKLWRRKWVEQGGQQERKAEGEHREDPEREDGTWMRSEGKRKTVEEEEESVLGKTGGGEEGVRGDAGGSVGGDGRE